MAPPDAGGSVGGRGPAQLTGSLAGRGALVGPLADSGSHTALAVRGRVPGGLLYERVVLFVCLSWFHIGAISSTVIAFFAGAIPNWVLNRRWAWEKRGREGVMKKRPRCT